MGRRGRDGFGGRRRGRAAGGKDDADEEDRNAESFSSHTRKYAPASQGQGGGPTFAFSASRSSQIWWNVDIRFGKTRLESRAAQPYCVSSVRTCVPMGVGVISHA